MFNDILRLSLAASLLACPNAFALCEDDGSDDSGNINADVTNALCINGQATSQMEEVGGGGVSLTPQTGLPSNGVNTVPFQRTIGGTSAADFSTGAPFNMPVTPGQEYRTNWINVVPGSTINSVHTSVQPKNMPNGYNIEFNAGDGNGWQSGNKVDRVGSSIDVTTNDHRFRIVRPIREAGRVGEIMLTKPIFLTNRALNSGGETRSGVLAIDADQDTYADVEIPAARFIMPLGAAMEDGRPVSAGDLVFHQPLIDTTGFKVNRSFLAYEGVDRSATGVDIRVDTNGDIRQIKAPGIFIDAVTTQSNTSFEIRLYKISSVDGQAPATNGFFAPTGTPHAIWTVTTYNNSSDQFSYGVSVSEAIDGQTVRSVQMQSAELSNSTVTKTRRIEGALTEVITNNVISINPPTTITLGGQQMVIGSTTGFTQVRDQTTILTKDSATAGETVERYAFAPTINGIIGMGEGILYREQIVGSGANGTLRTDFFHIWNSYWQGIYGSSIGKPFMEYYPDGSWERYAFDENGNRTQILRPYEGSPARPWDATYTQTQTGSTSNCVAETFEYDLDPAGAVPTGAPQGMISFASDLLTKRQVEILGVTTAKTVRTYSAVIVGSEPVLKTNIEEYQDAATHVDSEEEYYHKTASAELRGLPRSSISPTGEKMTYSYEMGDFDKITRVFTPSATGKTRRETKAQGTVASPAGIANKTTRAKQILCLCGKVFQEVTEVFTGGATYEIATVTDHYYDANHRKTETSSDGRTLVSIAYNGLTETTTDEEGAVFTVVRDLNGRVTGDSKTGGSTANTVHSGLSNTTTIGTLSRSLTVDKAGRATSRTDTQGRTISYDYPNFGRDLQIIRPGDNRVLKTRQPGGRISSMTNVLGESIIPRYYTYGVNTDGSQWMKESMVTANNVRYSKSTMNWLDQQTGIEVPAPSGSGTIARNWIYGSNGMPVKTTDSASVNLAPRLLEYNSLGQLFREGWDLGGTPDVLDTGSTDTILEYDHSFEKIGNDWYRVREVKQYQYNNVAVPSTLRKTKVRMSALSDGTSAYVIEIDANGVSTISAQTIDRGNKTMTTVTNRSDRLDTSTQIIINGLLKSSKTSADTTAETYDYDALERLWKTTSARTGAVSRRTYNAQGLVETVVDEALSRTTTYEYYPPAHANAGELKSITNAEQNKTFFEYNDRDQITRVWGDASHPEETIYDAYGSTYQTRSYRAGSGWDANAWPSSSTGTADTTIWKRDAATGTLLYIEDPSTSKTEFTWKDNGKMHTRKWARLGAGGRITTTYGYDMTGIETSRTYNDGLTPALTFTPDRARRIANMTDASGSRAIAHNAAGLTTGIDITGAGILSGFDFTLSRDIHGRHIGTSVTKGASPLYASSITYEAGSGRYSTVSLGDEEMKYVYRAHSNLIGELFWKSGDTPMLANVRNYDALDRLISTEHFKGVFAGGASLVSSYAYQLDDMNRREKTTLADGSWWDYSYNDRGELEYGDKKLPGGAFLAGQQFHFDNDNAGNRTSKETGGDASGVGRRSFASPANALNQPSSYGTPNTFDVVGKAPAATPVIVNGNNATRQNEFFHEELAAANSLTPAWTAVTVSAGGQSSSGDILTAPASVTPTYDLDGNLTFDGLWTYTWDGENRLIKVIRDLTGIPYRELRYTYDGNNRMIQRLIYHAPNAPPVSTEKFLHEASRRILTTNAADSPVQSFVWGIDLSNTPDNAHGTGGLLLIHDHSASASHFVCSDGNGNVTNLVKSTTGDVSATYEYSPFGEVIRSTGAYAASNPIRFSTRPQDSETGLLNYGLRHYKPDWGRWLSRDPLGNIDGYNLYGSMGNDPINSIDVGGGEILTPWARSFISELTSLETLGETLSDDYGSKVGNNFKNIGEGVVNGAKSAVDGVRNLPEIADFIASGEAADMIDQLLNDPDFRDKMAEHLGDEFCDFYNGLKSEEGAFQAYGETAFGVLSGSGALKLIKAFKAAKAAGKFAKASKKLDKIIPDTKKPLGGCFVAGTMILTAHAEVPIESLEVGNRVLASESVDATSWTEVDSSTWRKIDLVLSNPESPSEVLEITMLRPLAWIEESGCETGAVIPLELEESGISGFAEIKSISPCPEIEQGAGRVVLATITHINSDVRTLRLAEGDGTIELTGAHRLFSLDRSDWIATRDLQAGETLQTRNGRAIVESIHRKPGQQRVFNIEVETEHCFFVGESGVLSHNTNPCFTEIEIDRKRSPKAAKHLEDSGATDRDLTVDRSGRDARRRENMKGVDSEPGLDRDESPPAVFKESVGASVRKIPSGDNRSAGGQLGAKLRGVPDGSKVRIKVID